MRKSLRLLAIVAGLSFLSNFALAQLPGQIVRRHTVNSVLDPNPASGFTSNSTQGFLTNDVSESRIPFKVVKLPFSEPVGDLKTGATGSFTDLVTTPDDETGLMLHFDGNNLLFRVRVSGISAGAKAYSVLIDADMKAGNSGTQADPNYIAPTTSGNGNPGFEWELVLMTGNTTRVVLYEVDGKAGSSIVQQDMVENDNYQISKALSTTHNDADYFFDFYLPIAKFSGLHQIISSNKFRMVATTVSSPTSALQGNRSDVFGVNDANYALTADAWMAALGGSPGVSLNEISGNTTTTFGKCTSTPVITSSISLGNNVTISGTWTAASGGAASATINLYRQVNGVWSFVAATAAPVNSGSTWSIPGVTVSASEAYSARAVASGESECLYSTRVFSTCTAPAAPVVSCASTKGMSGTLPSGASLEVYELTAAGAINPLTTNLVVSGTTWNYYGASGTSTNACSGNTNIFTTGTAIMLVSNMSGCKSTAVFGCISGSNGNSTLSSPGSNDLQFTGPIYPFQTSVAGTSAAGITAGQYLRLYVNGVFRTGYSVAAATNSFSFSGLSLRVGDQLTVLRQTSGVCPSWSSAATVVCYNEPPIITAPGNKLPEGTSIISGTAAPGASVTLNRTAPTTASWPATANSSGQWSISGLTLVAGQTFTATVTSASGCATASAASSLVTVAPVTTQCPGFGASSYGTSSPYTAGGIVDVSAAGSVVRLYLDGALVGSQTLNTTGSGIEWSITSSEPFYNGGKLTATFQSGSTGTEKLDCSATNSERTISCSAPASPSVNPANASINQGLSQTYTISNVQTGLWYSIINTASGVTYAGTQASGITNLSLTTRAFSTPGTYNLLVEANDFSGCPAATAAATLSVQAIVLPVRFLNVAAQRTAGGNLVKWVVTAEQLVDHYVVERSTDCSRFESISIVPFKASSGPENHYLFNDVTAREQKYCYRIRQVNKNGSVTYSSTAIVQPKEQQGVSIFPNPAQNQAIINFTGSRDEIIKIELVDMAGKSVHTQKSRIQQGANAITMANLSQYRKGSYIVKLVSQEGVRLVTLIIQ